MIMTWHSAGVFLTDVSRVGAMHVAGDSCKVFARWQASKDWCGIYNWSREKSYMLSIYGHEGISRLACELVRRSSHYSNALYTSDDDDPDFTEVGFVP